MEMKKTAFAGIILLILLACTGVASAANLLGNGGFETPVNTASWQIYPDGTPGMVWHAESNDAAHPSSNNLEIQTESTLGLVPYEGRQYAELDPNYNVKISQFVDVNAGTSYKISFAQSCRKGDSHLPSRMGVYWDKTLLGQTSCSAEQAQTWATYSYIVTADSDATIPITFADEGYSDSFGVLLDDVKMEESTIPVPEFPSLALPVGLIIGLAGILVVSRDN